ncbi:MAG TPA: ATP-binding protein, partial [Polyangiaceae bacterium]|nr:ATP-binding protein [Polyangiaceae bacterium]
EQLARARRLETVAQLAAGIAHDFNNLLHIIQGHTQMMQLLDLGGFARESELREMLQEVDKAAGRAAVLVRQLLTFRRSDDAELGELPLQEVIEGCRAPLERLLGSQIQLVMTYSCPALVRGNRSQLEQVLTNLCLNARDALPRGGYLYVTLDAPLATELPALLRDGAGEVYVRLSVRDDGAGMTREVQQRLYEPFFTTKRPGEGVGLGLATVYAIVQSHRGFIDSTSARGQGTTFRVYLPRADRDAQVSTPRPLRIDGRGRIALVAEDEPAVSQLTSCFLRDAGFEVLLASNGPEATRRLRERGREIAIAVLDAAMPGFGGEAVLRHMHDLGMQAPVIFVTGYDYPALGPAHADERVVILRKPFGSEELLERVARLLPETA